MRKWNNLIPQEKEGVMEIVTSWMEEGLEKGLGPRRPRGRPRGRGTRIAHASFAEAVGPD